MKNNPLFYLFISFSTLLLVSCSQSTFDDIEANVEPLPEIVTYQDVKTTIDNICLACHSNPPQNGAPMSLVTYSNVKEAVLNRALLEKISKNEGEDGLMPLGGPRLPQQTIDLIFQWEVDGLLEN